MNAVALQRQLQYRLAQLGGVGLLGLVMAVLALAGWFILIRAGENELVSSQKRLTALRQQVQAKSSLPVSSALNHEEQLRVFYSSFPAGDKVPDALKQIYRAADKQELLLETGEYTWLQTGPERLARYRIALPVKGSFKQVLGFMDLVLQSNATLALENASFKRDKVDDATVEAKLVFLVYVDTQP
jgi:type VI protein secretion system component VasK